MSSGHVFWLFGLSGAGKTTLATGLERKFAQQRLRSTLVLDGDVLRSGLCRDLGFTDEARTENIRRAAEIARVAMLQGHVVIAAFITPREELRTLAAEIIGEDHLELIWADASLDVCRRRDPKGLYRRCDAGTLPMFTGVQSAFEAPARLHLRLRTDQGSAEALGDCLWNHCRARLGIG